MILVCAHCESKFYRTPKEAARSMRLRRRQFCSRRCATIIRNWEHSLGNRRVLVPGNRLDKHSPFRRHFRVLSRHAKEARRLCTVTLDDLLSQWERQQGRCPYTGWTLINPPTTRWPRGLKSPKLASVDRRDSRRGYTADNIQFVALIANYAKNDFTGDEMIEFCSAVNKNLGH